MGMGLSNNDVVFISLFFIIIRGYVSAIIGGYWSFAGWQGIPSVIEDVKEPR